MRDQEHSIAPPSMCWLAEAFVFRLIRPSLKIGIPGTKTLLATDRKEPTMMYDVPLSMKEIAITRFIIDRYRKAMIFEIANTDSRDLRDYLKQREELLEELINKLDSFSGAPGETEQID